MYSDKVEMRASWLERIRDQTLEPRDNLHHRLKHLSNHLAPVVESAAGALL